MTRASAYKTAYILFMIMIFGAALIVGMSTRQLVIPVLILIVVTVFPGMIQGFFWHEFFLGRRLLKKGQWKDALEQFDKFIARIKEKPSLKRMMWLRWSSFTHDVEAMALSNKGVAFVNMGEIDRAEECFELALEKDHTYPTPHFNLSLLEMVKDNEESARKRFQKARELGYAKVEFTQVRNLAKRIKSELEKKDESKEENNIV